MRKSDPKPRKSTNENLDLQEIKLNREKVEAATKLLPPVPKKLKLVKQEPNLYDSEVVSNIMLAGD